MKVEIKHLYVAHSLMENTNYEKKTLKWLLITGK